MRTDWGHVLDEGRGVVANYDTPVTLRQLFYRLVAVGLLSNTTSAYKGLSRVTADALWTGTVRDSRTARRHPAGTVVGLSRRTRSPPTAQYRLDRTARQAHQVWLGVEKATMLAQLDAWYGDRGLPVIALHGYTSESYVEDVAEAVAADGDARCCCHAGDWDPSGEDILRD